MDPIRRNRTPLAGSAGILALALLAGLLAAAPAPAQDRDFSQVEITSVKVADGIWMLQGAGGNLGVSVGEDGVFLIDDQYAPLTAKIRAAIAKISTKPIRFVFNTHWHGDHTGGNENLGKAGVLIVAHDNVRKRLSSDQFIEAFKQHVPASPKEALPVVTFNDTVTFHLNGQTLHAFHVSPAHTDGDSAVWFEEADVVHTGDLFFNGFYPFIDVGAGGSVDGMITAADRILGRIGDNTKLIPGHGPAGRRQDLVAFRDMLQGARDAVAPLVEAGKTLEEVQAAKPLAPFDEEWGKGFLSGEAFTAIVYASLKK